MYILFHNTHHSFELLPSISVHSAFGVFVCFIAWFTFAIEIGKISKKSES